MTNEKRITLITFGFKYGAPNANYYFDVSFLTNPAREAKWGLFAKPSPEMRDYVLEQPSCQRFLDRLVPLVATLVELDDDARIGIGCSSGRHRSYIVAEELKRRLEAGDGIANSPDNPSTGQSSLQTHTRARDFLGSDESPNNGHGTAVVPRASLRVRLLHREEAYF